MDVVNKPPHYQGEVEAIDSIKAAMSYEAFKGYLHGNAIKYLMRWTKKNGVEDLRKAEWYLRKLISIEDGKNRTL